MVGGVWLPDNEDHFADWMLHSKRARRVDGKATYQYHKLEAALRYQPAERRRVCLDIGAHVGLWAMWLVREFERVHAFEPVPLFAEIFPHNLGMANVSLHMVALGDRQDTVAITVPDGQTGGAQVSIEGPHPGNKYARDGKSVYRDIPMRTLDSFALDKVDFIKIDVEAMELDVIHGARATIEASRPILMVEVQNANRTQFEAILDSLGYTITESFTGPGYENHFAEPDR